jgi:hypothetical protein
MRGQPGAGRRAPGERKTALRVFGREATHAGHARLPPTLTRVRTWVDCRIDKITEQNQLPQTKRLPGPLKPLPITTSARLIVFAWPRIRARWWPMTTRAALAGSCWCTRRWFHARRSTSSKSPVAFQPMECPNAPSVPVTAAQRGVEQGWAVAQAQRSCRGCCARPPPACC